MPIDTSNFPALEEKLGHRFHNRELLVEALLHPSYRHAEHSEQRNYQRLEFLGDAVLSSIVADELFRLFPAEQEGVLTRNRTLLAGGKALAELATEMGLGEYAFFGPGEVEKGSRQSFAVLEDVLEALVGAIFLDSNWMSTRRIVLRWYGDIPRRLHGIVDDFNPKGRLQEVVQPVLGNNAITYEIVDTTGPDHDRLYVAEVEVEGETKGRGEGPTKKIAEENAARDALSRPDSILPPA